MGLIDSLLGRSKLADVPALTDFIDRRAAFLTQKAVFEYARARSGLLSSKLFKEEAFKAAIEQSRWQNYALCLQCVALMVEHALRSEAREAAPAVRDGIVACVAEVCRRYPPPSAEEADFWPAARARIARRIAQAGLAAPHAIKDIPKEIAKTFFRNMPFHAEVRSHDFELITNNLRFNLCRAYDDFIAAADRPALVRALVAAERSPTAGG